MANKNTDDFEKRFRRWQNGEAYWDIVGRPLAPFGAQQQQQDLTEDQLRELDNYIQTIHRGDEYGHRDGYYDYMEKLSANKAKEWDQNPDVTLLNMLNDNTYNYRAMYDVFGGDDTNHQGHFTDAFKTSYHPTFSEQSAYSGVPS